jgi:hypothetical protein
LTLKSLFKRAKLKNVQEALFQPLLRTREERKLISLLFYEIKDKLLQLKLLSEKEWTVFIKQLEKIEKDEAYSIFATSMYLISGIN